MTDHEKDTYSNHSANRSRSSPSCWVSRNKGVRGLSVGCSRTARGGVNGASVGTSMGASMGVNGASAGTSMGASMGDLWGVRGIGGVSVRCPRTSQWGGRFITRTHIHTNKGVEQRTVAYVVLRNTW